MTSHENGPNGPTNHEIVEASERQHVVNLDAQLAMRGLLKIQGRVVSVDKQAVIEYIESLEQRLAAQIEPHTP